MNKGLQKKRFPELSPEDLQKKEKQSLLTRLTKLGFENNNIIESIYQ